jgi:alanyl-tRNA synthetase
VHDKIAHTAEHAFIGSLQHLLNRTLRVRKVEHKGSSNTAFIVTPNLDLSIVLRAESQVNSLIAQGRNVTRRTFQSIDEAKKQVPALRANEERISGEVKVVTIENHDVAACAMEHTSNLRECDFFLVTRLSKSGTEYEVDFVVGQQAKETAISMSAKLLSVCSAIGANVNTIENTVKRVLSENVDNHYRLKALSREKLEGMSPQGNGRTTLLKGIFSNLSDEELQEFAGEKIANENTIVLLANTGSSEMANMVFARNEKMANIDCNKIFKQFAGADARGGGKPHFIRGVVKKDIVSNLIERISSEILQ